MDNFFKSLNDLTNFRIFIMSDHGSRITKEDISSFSTIFAYKDYMKKTSENITEKISIQSLFKSINNE